MKKIIRRALLIAVIYLAGVYYSDRPEEAETDAAAALEATAEVSESARVMASVTATGQKAGQSVLDAKQRLDWVRAKVQNQIARGAERFAGSD